MNEPGCMNNDGSVPGDGLIGSEVHSKRVGSYDAVFLDLDGVVYTGKTMINGVDQALNAWHRRGVPYTFLTNNAAREVEEIAQTIRSFGVPVKADHVRTSAQAVAEALQTEIAPGQTVLTLGSEFLRTCLRNAGFNVVTSADTGWLKHHTPAAVVQGFNADTNWTDLTAAITAVRAGALYRPTNPDVSIPTRRGIQPGNGTFVKIVVEFTGQEPQFAGKPEPVMLYQAATRLSAQNPVMVGDQLDTDIAAACAAGFESALVLTGVCTVKDALRAPHHLRPSRIISSLLDLETEPPTVEVGDTWARCGEAGVTITETSAAATHGEHSLEVSHSGPVHQAVHAALTYARTHNTALELGTLPERYT